MTAFRAGRVERRENLLQIDLSAGHPAILVMVKEKRKHFFVLSGFAEGGTNARPNPDHREVAPPSMGPEKDRA